MSTRRLHPRDPHRGVLAALLIVCCAAPIGCDEDTTATEPRAQTAGAPDTPGAHATARFEPFVVRVTDDRVVRVTPDADRAQALGVTPSAFETIVRRGLLERGDHAAADTVVLEPDVPRRAAVVTLRNVARVQTTTRVVKPSGQRYLDRDGTRIHYVAEGEGEPVVLLHGLCANVFFQWQTTPILSTLNRHHRILAMDCRGHGRSDKPHDPQDYGIHMVEDVIALLDVLDIEQAHVVGYSLGGFVAAKLAVTHPRRVRSAVIVAAGWVDANSTWWSVVGELAESLEADEGYGPLIRTMTRRDVPVATHEQIASTNAMLSLVNDEKAIAALTRSMHRLAIEREQIAALRVPVMAIVGQHDPIKRDMVDPLPGLVPGLRVEVVPGADHVDVFLNPRFTQAVIDFIGAHGASAP